MFPLLDISPISLETCNLPPHPCWHSLQENTRFYDDTLESGRLKTINIKPWKPIIYKNCVLSNGCVLIDIVASISMAVGTECNFPHGEVGIETHHIKRYNIS